MNRLHTPATAQRRRDTLLDPILASVHGKILSGQLSAMLAEAIDRLPEQERLVVTLYHFEELVTGEIANVLGVTELRVLQVYQEAAFRLRKRLIVTSRRLNQEADCGLS